MKWEEEKKEESCKQQCGVATVDNMIGGRLLSLRPQVAKIKCTYLHVCYTNR